MAPVARVKILRTRVYAGTCPHGEPVWSATHALHVPKKGNQAALFLLGEDVSYTKRARAGLKTAARLGDGFQRESRQVMRFSRGWDEKRRLLADGSTQPWATARQAEARLEKAQRRSAAEAPARKRARRATKKATNSGGINVGVAAPLRAAK